MQSKQSTKLNNNILITPVRRIITKGLFTWGGGPRSSGVGFFCFHALGDTKQKKLTPLHRGPPTPCKQGLNNVLYLTMISLFLCKWEVKMSYSHVTPWTPNIFNILNGVVFKQKLFLCVISSKSFWCPCFASELLIYRQLIMALLPCNKIKQ